MRQDSRSSGCVRKSVQSDFIALAVAQLLFRGQLWHDFEYQRDECRIHYRGHNKYIAPTMNAGDPAGEGAGEQDAEKQTGHHCADGSSALLVQTRSGAIGSATCVTDANMPISALPATSR